MSACILYNAAQQLYSADKTKDYTFVFDMMSMLPLPKLECNLAFYKRQLWTYFEDSPSATVLLLLDRLLRSLRPCGSSLVTYGDSSAERQSPTTQQTLSTQTLGGTAESNSLFLKSTSLPSSFSILSLLQLQLLSLLSMMQSSTTFWSSVYAQHYADFKRFYSADKTKDYTFVFDMMSMLPLPKLECNLAFYKRQLWTYFEDSPSATVLLLLDRLLRSLRPCGSSLVTYGDSSAERQSPTTQQTLSTQTLGGTAESNSLFLKSTSLPSSFSILSLLQLQLLSLLSMMQSSTTFWSSVYAQHYADFKRFYG